MTAAAQRGTTTVSERAVRRIAERATTEALPARTARASASVRGRRADVSLAVTLPYPAPAPLADTVRDVQRHVVERTRELTGLDVPAARVSVTSLAPPTSSSHPLVSPALEAHPADPDGRESRTPRRWWSRRRTPVTVLSAVAALGCGALAFDLVRVHTAHRTAAAWRTSAVHWATGHGPGDPAVVALGGLIALLGIWMIVLALSPGRRRQSTIRTSAAHVDAAVDRSAVAALVRDAVGDVDGVGTVRVRVRRRRVTVRAGLAFGDRAHAHTAVTAAARDALADCLLSGGPRLRVTVKPERMWQRPTPTADTPGHGDGASTPAVPASASASGDHQ
ncbi:DUF6286 domain-containing protein [Streptomyces sp. SID12488]|uniref:DUF6286 domain-containing Asp23/Gls24 family envelope stress response protein n=1 Tax=Streptomyces sp. SID12488 TaxID=2706040 RepID=UPI0013DC5042|nr:DUF6286 domain-containing protein [Streptomyces sp. SID12488]NEA68517.1 Asp23/Gls24 family envelope stress response protein [Streptomyces sp. SID12488]